MGDQQCLGGNMGDQQCLGGNMGDRQCLGGNMGDRQCLGGNRDGRGRSLGTIALFCKLCSNGANRKVPECQWGGRRRSNGMCSGTVA